MAKSRRKQSNRAGPSTTNAVPQASSHPRPDSDQRAAERIQRQQARAAARRRYELQRRIRATLIALVVLLSLGGGIVWFLQTNAAAAPDGRTVPIVSPFDHIPEGTTVTNYNTTPPTSGQHYTSTANPGVHDTPIPNEVQVHNLEHGQVMLQYTCTDCPDLVEQLKPFADRYGQWVIIAPYPDESVGARIALTAWGAIDTFDEFDEDRIVRFIEAYKNKGPEKVFRD